MYKKIINKLREKRGSAFLQGAVTVFLLMMFMVACFTGLGVMNKKQRLDTLADEIKRIIEIDGRYSDCEITAANTLLAKNNIQASVSCSASGNIHLGDSFTVTLSTTGSLGIGGFSGISIPLTAKADGKSEVYWK